MSLETQRPAIIAFDGLHRTGKGTQADMLQAAVIEAGGRSVTVRGDGTREGLGLHAGDPYSEEWQTRSHRVKSPEGNSVEAWNAASYILGREVAQIVKTNTEKYDSVLVDRSLISRAAFLLHRGVGLQGRRLSMEEMYPDHEVMAENDKIDFTAMVPDVIFDLQVDSPESLLKRLNPNDRKYQFRARNIRGGFHSASIASEHLPRAIEQKVVKVDALGDPRDIHNQVITHLSNIGLLRSLPI